MLKQALIALGILTVFACADVPTSNEQFITGGCSEGSDSVGENQYLTPDTTAPTISSPPTSGATDVSVSADITVPFSEEMDASTINSTNITVVDGSGNPVNGIWTYSGTTATFNPDSDLSYSTTYTVTVGTGVKDRAGNALGSVLSWNFTTVATWIGTKQLGTSSGDSGWDIATDSNGNVYVTGYTGGSLDGNANAGFSDLFVVKYDNSGVKLWTQQLGTSEGDIALGITIDSNDNVYVTGYTSGGLDGNSNAGGDDLFVVKYNSDGVKQWTQQLGTSNNDRGFKITSDVSDNIYITGYTLGNLDGDSNDGTSDPFVVKYSSAGVKLWTRQLRSGTGADVTSDSEGNIYVTGYVINPEIVKGFTYQDVFLVKYDSAGVVLWEKQFGYLYDDVGKAITIDNSNNVYVTGETYGGLDGNNIAGGNDLFVVKYNNDGVKQWTQQLGTSFTEAGNGITSDSLGNVYVTGETYGGLDGSTSEGKVDLFVVKYNSSGVKQWTQQLGTSEGDIALGITTDSNDNVYVTGYTSGGLDGNISAGSSDLFVVKYNSDGVKQ